MENLINIKLNRVLDYPGVIIFGKNPFCQFNIHKSKIGKLNSISINYQGEEKELELSKGKFIGEIDGFKITTAITETKNYNCGFMEMELLV